MLQNVKYKCQIIAKMVNDHGNENIHKEKELGIFSKEMGGVILIGVDIIMNLKKKRNSVRHINNSIIYTLNIGNETK